MRRPRGLTDRHEINRVRGRARNLERRFLESAPELTETSPVWGSIRFGTGPLSILSGALNATTTLVTHSAITAESGVDCDIVSSPTRITLLESGLYVVKSELLDVDTGGTDYGLTVGYGWNSSSAVVGTFPGVRRVNVGVGGVPGGASYIGWQLFDAGDYLTQVVGQNSGSTKTFNYLGSLSVARIPGSITTADVLDELDGGSP